MFEFCELNLHLVTFNCVGLFLQISLGDLKVLVTYSAFVVFGFNCNIDDYPKLKSHKERVENEPRIAAWIAKRPDSTF